MGRFWRHVTGDSQLRWIGPDKGAIHLATGAVVNAAWDLRAKSEGKADRIATLKREGYPCDTCPTPRASWPRSPGISRWGSA